MGPFIRSFRRNPAGSLVRLRYLIVVVCLIIVGIWVLPQSSGAVAVDKIGGFKSPTRIAATISGDVYVSDHKKGNVVILDSDGRKIGTIDGFSSPLGLAVHEIPPAIDCRKYKEKKDKCKDPIIGEGRTYVYVGDEGDGSVHVFTNGVATGLLGVGPGEFIKPNGIAVTSELIAYVVDSATNQIRVISCNALTATIRAMAMKMKRVGPHTQIFSTLSRLSTQRTA